MLKVSAAISCRPLPRRLNRVNMYYNQEPITRSIHRKYVMETFFFSRFVNYNIHTFYYIHTEI